jgi:hypothetical protein
MLIGRELEDRGISTPAAIGDALGMPAAEATKLLTRHQLREARARLGERSSLVNPAWDRVLEAAAAE